MLNLTTANFVLVMSLCCVCQQISSALPGSGGRRRDDSVWQRKYELEREKVKDVSTGHT